MIKSTAEIMQSQLAEIGIQAELVLPDWATRIVLGNRGQYDITVNGTTNESNDPDGMSNIIGTDLPVSYTRSYGLSLPELDALLADGRRTFGFQVTQGDLREDRAARGQAGTAGGAVLAGPRLCHDEGSRRVHQHSRRVDVLLRSHARDGGVHALSAVSDVVLSAVAPLWHSGIVGCAGA